MTIEKPGVTENGRKRVHMKKVRVKSELSLFSSSLGGRKTAIGVADDEHTRRIALSLVAVVRTTCLRMF